MGKRLIWIGAVLLSSILYLFENNAGTLTVLAGVLVVPVLGMLPLLGKEVRLDMTLLPAQEKGNRAKGMLRVTNPTLLPLPKLGLTVSCKNKRTGETHVSRLELSLLPKQERQVEFLIDCPRCGKMELTAGDVRISDVFGLFECKLPCEARKSFTVLPQLFEPSIFLEHSDMAMPESDTYSATKPGSDPGETFAIREYVPGDAIRSIHWKLSGKTGKTMVRQFGLPVVNEVALFLETAGEASPEELDAITEVFASVSSKLAEAEILHHVFWRDDKTDELMQFSVTTSEEFTFMLEQLLELPPNKDGDLARRFLEHFPHCPYSHVVMVGSQIPAGVRDLYNGNRVSLLLPRQDGVAEGLQGDGTHVLTFDSRSYAADLCRLEV